jgi:hypothetical protein
MIAAGGLFHWPANDFDGENHFKITLQTGQCVDFCRVIYTTCRNIYKIQESSVLGRAVRAGFRCVFGLKGPKDNHGQLWILKFL